MKKNKKYLKLRNFEESGVTNFGWQEVDPKRRRKAEKILESDMVIKISDNNSETFISEKDVKEYVLLSLGTNVQDLYSDWSSNPSGFEEKYNKMTLSYKDGDGLFFIKLCDLLLNNTEFSHNGKELIKI